MTDTTRPPIDTSELPPWAEKAAQEAWERAQYKIADMRNTAKYRVYADDPVGFGTNVLGELFTDDIKKVMESVRDNPVTIARSCTGPGKSHAAARIAVWFYRVFDDAKVFMTAAPPLENLKKILWGEVMSVVRKKPELFVGHRGKTLLISRNESSFITGVAIPTSGTPEERQAKFCTDAEEIFEHTDGSLSTYRDLIGKYVPVATVDQNFRRVFADAEFFDNGLEEVFEITLSSGQRVRRTGAHPLYSGQVSQDFHTHGGKHVKGRYRTAPLGWTPVGALKSGDVVLIPEDTSFNFGVDSMDEDAIKVMAYLIGDGDISSTHRILFIQQNNVQLDDFRRSAENLGARVLPFNTEEYSWKINGDGSGKEGSNPVINMLRTAGILGCDSSSKFIPDCINRLGRDDIALFLSRLYSTDGWACVGKAGNYEKAEIGYSSKSERLVEDVQRLLKRFGIESKIVKKRTSWQHNGQKKTGVCWSCVINRAPDILSFADQIGIFGKEQAVADCVAYTEKRTVYASWRRSDHPGFRWERIRQVRSLGVRPTVGVCVPGNETYLTSLVEHNSGKHAPHLLFIVDEGDAVPDEVYKGIEGCMSGGYARLLIMFNPKIQAGPVYMKEKERKAAVIHLSAFTHPNVITGNNVIPGAVDRNITLRRINEWTRPMAPNEPFNAECFEVPPFLYYTTAQSLDGTDYPPLEPGPRRIVNPAFAYMVMGEYPAEGERQLINQVWIDNARARHDLYVASHGEVPPAGIQPVLGLDVAELGVDANVACLRYGGYIAPLIRWTGVDPDVTARRGLMLYQENNCRIAMVDGTGVGSSVAPSMARMGRSIDCRAISIKLGEGPTPFIKTELGEFYMLRDQLYWALREWLRTDPGAMLPNDPYLVDELRAPSYEVTMKGKVRITDKDTLRDLLRRSPDRSDALAMTFAPFDRPRILRLGE